MPRVYSQAKYWILTIRHADFLPYKPNGVEYITGQLELGEGGFLHWQLMVAFERKLRLAGVKVRFFFLSANV